MGYVKTVLLDCFVLILVQRGSNRSGASSLCFKTAFILFQDFKTLETETVTPTDLNVQ